MNSPIPKEPSDVPDRIEHLENHLDAAHYWRGDMGKVPEDVQGIIERLREQLVLHLPDEMALELLAAVLRAETFEAIPRHTIGHFLQSNGVTVVLPSALTPVAAEGSYDEDGWDIVGRTGPSPPEATAGVGERIDRAAICSGTLIFSVPAPGRHGDVFKKMTEYGPIEAMDEGPDAQGFLTSTGRFVHRDEARKIAEAAGQLLPNARKSADLFSEDVWDTPSPVLPEASPPSDPDIAGLVERLEAFVAKLPVEMFDYNPANSMKGLAVEAISALRTLQASASPPQGGEVTEAMVEAAAGALWAAQAQAPASDWTKVWGPARLSFLDVARAALKAAIAVLGRGT